MAEKLLMLALSPTMESGLIARWIKKEGEAFRSGDVLCEVETDKAVMEYEAPNDGYLLKIVRNDGDTVAVGETIAITGKSGEEISALLEVQTGNTPGPKVASLVQQTGEDHDIHKSGHEDGLSLTPEINGEDSDINSEAIGDRLTEAIGDRQIRSSPLARKIADNAGIILSEIKGSGPMGRIVKRDIEKAVSEKTAVFAGQMTGGPVKSDVQSPGMAFITGLDVRGGIASALRTDETMPRGIASTLRTDETIPLSGKRRIIAQRLSESMFSAPHYYLKSRVEMDGILTSRKHLNENSGKKISFNAFMIKFVAEALKKHPVINSGWTGNSITRFGSIDIGLAVAQKDGLITPVVRNCGAKGILEIEDELKKLIEKALGDQLKPDEYTGATFTISNLGSFGIEEFTAIINPPGSAILALGETRREQVVGAGDNILIRSVMRMTLSCDHRVIDGAVGAAFLAELKGMLEEPVRVLY